MRIRVITVNTLFSLYISMHAARPRTRGKGQMRHPCDNWKTVKTEKTSPDADRRRLRCRELVALTARRGWRSP